MYYWSLKTPEEKIGYNYGMLYRDICNCKKFLETGDTKLLEKGEKEENEK